MTTPQACATCRHYHPEEPPQLTIGFHRCDEPHANAESVRIETLPSFWCEHWGPKP